MCDLNWAESIDRTATGRYSCRISVMSARGRTAKLTADKHYAGLVRGIGDLLEAARRTSARAVNALMTATYWEVGRRIVEFEQGGKRRAKYGEELLKQCVLSASVRDAGDRRLIFSSQQRGENKWPISPWIKISSALPSGDRNHSSAGPSLM